MNIKLGYFPLAFVDMMNSEANRNEKTLELYVFHIQIIVLLWIKEPSKV